MTNYGKSLFYFGIYVLLIGILLLLMPGRFLDILHLPAISSGWARVIGIMAVIIGMYDILSGRNNIRILAKASVYLRILFFAVVLWLFLSDQMPKEALPLGVIDLAGAIWTYIALKGSAKNNAA